ncbi:MAG: DUF4113 domain-containing protein [Chromatiaceae bacterium]|nr:DUF4113 domain-containing protein [Chromatiaceae bacterium]
MKKNFRNIMWFSVKYRQNPTRMPRGCTRRRMLAIGEDLTMSKSTPLKGVSCAVIVLAGFVNSKGGAGGQPWRMRRERLSPADTSRWKALPGVG